MVGVNLLPREVLERRRYEGWYRYIIFGFIVLLVLLLIAYVALALSVSGKNDQVQRKLEEAQSYQAKANELAVFEEKEQTLQSRLTVAQTALSGRVNVGKVMNDISLVLPDEVWLDSITVNEDAGVTILGNTPRSTSQTADVAYKSIAKTLVRLNEVDGLSDVWLTSAANTTWSKWAVDTNEVMPEPTPVVSFQLTGTIEQSEVPVKMEALSGVVQR
ncbi:MAG: PilN domain-containing protein [Coriobacteriia bacterium]